MDKKMPKKISLKDFGMEKIILIAIAGIVLLAANFSEWKNSSSKTSEKQEKSIETSQNDAYVEALENKLVHILENVDGVGKAEVMITLKSSKESVLNKDLSEEKQTEEERSGETQKVNKNQKKQEETILSDSSGNSAPYVIKELEPEISGIVISCEGAGNKVVEASVLEAVQVLFGVSANLLLCCCIHRTALRLCRLLFVLLKLFVFPFHPFNISFVFFFAHPLIRICRSVCLGNASCLAFFERSVGSRCLLRGNGRRLRRICLRILRRGRGFPDIWIFIVLLFVIIHDRSFLSVYW